MPRKALFRTTEFPYHLTARANNRECFPGELEFIWKTISGEIYLQHLKYELRVHAFVLMPNHFHLLATSPERSIDLVMKEIQGSTTRIVNTRHRRHGHLFCGRYYWSLIDSPLYFANVLKYVVRNPVKAALCESVAEFPFSTYAGLVGNCHLPFALFPPGRNLDLLLPAEASQRDHWLNTPHGAEVNEVIRKGLRRKQFKVSVDRKTRQPVPLDFDAGSLPEVAGH